MKVLVTGGGGFLGKKICTYLRNDGHDVTSFSRKDYPELRELGVHAVNGDVGNFADCMQAVTGCDAVVHSAALAGFWGDPQVFYKTNVLGTENILRAAQEAKVKYLVYTSSPSVVFDGKDILGVDEKSISYPEHFLSAYGHTKRLAEATVLSAHQEKGFATLALRPHLIWGEEDPHFLPRFVKKMQEGKSFQVGSGKNLVDVIYVDNAAIAHVKALEALAANPSKVGGQPYFIGQEEPVNLWQFIRSLVDSASAKGEFKKLPFPLAYQIGNACEKFYPKFFGYTKEPPITRFVAQYMHRSHYFSHVQAEKLLGYKVRIPTQDGLERMKKYYQMNPLS